jgi:hypothetical protein
MRGKYWSLNNSILLLYTVTSIVNALKMEVRRKCAKWYSYINATGRWNTVLSILLHTAVQLTSVYVLYNYHFLDSSGGGDVQCRRCDSKKAKVHLYSHRSPEVSLLEVCPPLDTLLAIALLLFSDSCLSTVHLEMAMVDTEVSGRGIVKLSGLWTNHPNIHPTQRNYWVFGLCPLPSILETRKHRILETGFVSVLRWGKTYSVESLRKSWPQSLDQMMDKVQKAVILSIDTIIRTF